MRCRRRVNSDGSLNSARLRFKSHAVVYGVSQLLLRPEITFCRLDRNVSQEKLNLFEFTTRYVAKPRACSSKIVRGERFDSGFRSRSLNHLPNHLGGYAITPDAPFSVDRSEDSAARDPRCARPFIDSALDPYRHGNCPNVIGFAMEIGDYPVFFS